MSAASLVLSAAALIWCGGLTAAVRRLPTGRHRGPFKDGGER